MTLRYLWNFETLMVHDLQGSLYLSFTDADLGERAKRKKNRNAIRNVKKKMSCASIEAVCQKYMLSVQC